jgi:5'-methylthioadenosine phosphorylase
MKIGIIGGSGLDNPELLQDYKEVSVKTPYGNPSSKITCGKINGIEVCILARHGKKHEINPTNVNYRANIHALKELGCSHIIATSAVGSLKEQIHPGDLVFTSQFLDFTKNRKNTFFDKTGDVRHQEMAEPFSQELRKVLIETTEELGFRKHDNATIVVIEGPRFSSRAESFMFRNFADIIGMTTVPECVLAKELGINYASIAMATDYDCWKHNEQPVTFEMVKKTMKENGDKVKQVIINTLPKIKHTLSDSELNEFIKNKIRTVPNWPKKGIMFRDITTLLKDAEGFEATMNILEERYKDKNIDLIAGIESRGFILASALASRLNKGLVLIRKPGKLPSAVVKEEYTLEYGKDAVEIHKDAITPEQNILLIDDLIATGGTAAAAGNLIEKLGGNLIECAFVIDLPDLKGKDKLRWPVFCIVEFKGE